MYVFNGVNYSIFYGYFSDLGYHWVLLLHNCFFFLNSRLGYFNNNLGQYYNFLLLYDFIDINMSCTYYGEILNFEYFENIFNFSMITFYISIEIYS